MFRLRPGYTFSCFDSNALERRLGSGLLLRHPQVSNQNSKERTTINPTRRVDSARKIRPDPLPPSSFLFWPVPPSISVRPSSSSQLRSHNNNRAPTNKIRHPTEQRALLIEPNSSFCSTFFHNCTGCARDTSRTNKSGCRTILDRMSLGVFSAPVYGPTAPKRVTLPSLSRVHPLWSRTLIPEVPSLSRPGPRHLYFEFFLWRPRRLYQPTTKA